MLLNPNKYIRQAYVDLLSELNIPIFDKQLPSTETIPAIYILIQSQTKRERSRNKCDKNWDSTTSIDIYARSLRGIVDSAVVDDIEESITALLAPDVNTDIEIPNFKVYNTWVEEPVDVPLQTPTETILHRILRFRHDLGELPGEPPPTSFPFIFSNEFSQQFA